MGTTTYFACDECEETCWVGKNSTLYGYQYIPDWLYLHRNHRIRFLTEHDFDLDEKLYEYTECPHQDDNKMQYATGIQREMP